MKKSLKVLFASLLLTFISIMQFPLNTNAVERNCDLYGQYHRATSNTSHVKLKLPNGNKVNGTLWTCGCTEQVIVFDYNMHCYVSDCTMDADKGYPYIPGTASFYVPSRVYSGMPSAWKGVN